MFENRTIRRRIGAGLVTLAGLAAILAVPAAPAQAGLPSGVGPSVSTVTAARSDDTECLRLYAANNAGGIYEARQCGNNIHDTSAPNGWSSWQALNGRAKSTAKYVASRWTGGACCNGEITLAVHGTDNYYYVLSGSTDQFPSAWTRLPAIPGGTCASCTPSIATNADGMPVVFAEGSGGLYFIQQNSNGSWGTVWYQIPGPSAGDPGSTDMVTANAAAFGGGAYFVASQFNGTMKYTYMLSDNTGWKAWTSLGTGYDYPNALDTDTTDYHFMDFSATNSSGGVFNRHWNGTSWSGWARVTNGTTHSGNRHIAVTRFCASEYALAVVGTDQAPWVNFGDGGVFGNWTRVAGTDNAGGFLTFGEFQSQQGLFWIDSSNRAWYSYTLGTCSPQWSTPIQLTGLPSA